MIRFRKPRRIVTIGADDRSRVVALMRTQPYTSMLASQSLPYIATDSAYVGVEDDDGELKGLVAIGSNSLPVGEVWTMAPIADYLVKKTRRPISIVGRAELVHALWDRVDGAWGKARDIRGNQPCLTMSEPSPFPEEPRVRRGTEEDFDRLFPAAVAMFMEEVGYDPTADGTHSYAFHVRSLLASNRSFLIEENDQVIFKADIGAQWDGIAQIQGVWVHPDYRGAGLGTAAMASVTNQILESDARTVSLYVNDYNERARRVYEKVGYVQSDTFATILT